MTLNILEIKSTYILKVIVNGDFNDMFIRNKC